MGFLHRTISRLIAAEATVGDFLAQADQLASASPREFEVLVPFHSMPQRQLLAEELPEWRTGPQTREWLTVHSPSDAVYQKNRTLYRVIDEDLLDNALELAAPLNRGARGPAVAGGWAALESLLYHSGERWRQEQKPDSPSPAPRGRRRSQTYLSRKPLRRLYRQRNIVLHGGSTQQ
jgi:hypothetical protein